MSSKCSNCGRYIMGRYILACPCGTFCSEECMIEYHGNDDKDEEVVEIPNEN